MKKAALVVAGLILVTSTLSARTVLIAKEDTGYKKALVNTLIDKLEAEGLEVEVIDHKRGELDNVDPGDYAVVYVTNSGAQARVRPQVLEWLASIRGNDSNVIVHTTKINEWDENLNVDSLSSASQRSNIDDVTDDIMRRIRAKL